MTRTPQEIATHEQQCLADVRESVRVHARPDRPDRHRHIEVGEARLAGSFPDTRIEVPITDTHSGTSGVLDARTWAIRDGEAIPAFDDRGFYVSLLEAT
jgi:hypothetical protein